MTSNQQVNSRLQRYSLWNIFGKVLIASCWTLVVLVLFMLAVGVVAPYDAGCGGGRKESDRVSAAKTQIASFSTALDAFEVDNGYFPKGSNGLQALAVQLPDAPAWHGPYLKEIPQDPWRHDYIYQCPGQHNPETYDLMSMGPNGQAGDKDDITNWKRS